MNSEMRKGLNLKEEDLFGITGFNEKIFCRFTNCIYLVDYLFDCYYRLFLGNDYQNAKELKSAFITSIMLPLVLEMILIILLCQYIVIDEEGIKKYIFKKKIVEYKWEEIKEIKIDMGAIYISLDFLNGEKKYWDKKRYIFIMYSDKAISTLKKYKKEWIIDNFNSL